LLQVNPNGENPMLGFAFTTIEQIAESVQLLLLLNTYLSVCVPKPPTEASNLLEVTPAPE
jgi:hypothetical protein|tara:strand:+ start:270 stop:449 length:180 start_codon:yes stop_codon:yes gene_type:complete